MDASISGTPTTSVQTDTINKALEVQQQQITKTMEQSATQAQEQTQTEPVDTAQKTGMGNGLDTSV